jgi:hypothetical protein
LLKQVEAACTVNEEEQPSDSQQKEALTAMPGIAFDLKKWLTYQENKPEEEGWQEE